jgi:hypothetical protein
MELINATRMVAGYTMGRDADGRESLVVVVKGTFALPSNGETQVRLHDEQAPLELADIHSGEPGRSAPLREIDFAPTKPACDVLLTGSAYAPAGREATHVEVGLRVGPVNKRCEVVGDRRWDAGLFGIRASGPQPFSRQPVSYDVAFGGVDVLSDDPADHAAFGPNPVGRGYHKQLKSAWVDGRPMPNTQEIGRPVAWPSETYNPMAFGPLGRHWSQRAAYAGTYDQRWLEEDYPFLPRDFDARYFQAAPIDQQIPLPIKAPLEVVLTHFTPDGRRAFELPYLEAPLHVFPRRGPRQDHLALLDTISFETDAERFTMTWRASVPLRRNMFEISQVLVGRKGREWWQQRSEARFPIPVVMVPMPRDPAPSDPLA